MLPPKCDLVLKCQEEDPCQSLIPLPWLPLGDLPPSRPAYCGKTEPINIGLEHTRAPLDTASPQVPTHPWSLGCEDSWKRAKEDWYITRSLYGPEDPFVAPSCPPSSPVHIGNPPAASEPETMFGRKTHVLETPLSGETRCQQEGIPPPIGKRYAAVPKEESLNLFRQMCTFDIIVHSEELAQILYNLFSERLSSK